MEFFLLRTLSAKVVSQLDAEIVSNRNERGGWWSGEEWQKIEQKTDWPGWVSSKFLDPGRLFALSFW